MYLKLWSLVNYKMQVNGFQHFENKQKHIKDHKINTHSFWWYTEILWSETIGLCKKLNIIYNIITPNPTLLPPNLLLSSSLIQTPIIFCELVLSDSLFQ